MPFLQGEVDELLARCHRRRDILARTLPFSLIFGALSLTLSHIGAPRGCQNI